MHEQRGDIHQRSDLSIRAFWLKDNFVVGLMIFLANMPRKNPQGENLLGESIFISSVKWNNKYSRK